MPSTDPHEILGVDANASPQEIKAAYRRLTWGLHPDRSATDPEAAERLLLVNAAHEQIMRGVTRVEPAPAPAEATSALVSFPVRSTVIAGLVAMVVSVAAGAALARSNGADVDGARSAGARAGRVAGARRAERRSRQAGERAGRVAGYRAVQRPATITIPPLSSDAP